MHVSNDWVMWSYVRIFIMFLCVRVLDHVCVLACECVCLCEWVCCIDANVNVKVMYLCMQAVCMYHIYHAHSCIMCINKGILLIDQFPLRGMSPMLQGWCLRNQAKRTKGAFHQEVQSWDIPSGCCHCMTASVHTLMRTVLTFQGMPAMKRLRNNKSIAAALSPLYDFQVVFKSSYLELLCKELLWVEVTEHDSNTTF